MCPCPAALVGPPAARLLSALCLCAFLFVLTVSPACATAPTPWGGSPVAVAATGTTTVQATGYDLGGEGVAYHDYDNGGQTAYRSDNIGVPGAAAFGWAYAGEWEGYTLSVAQAGTYTLTVHANNQAWGGTCHLEFGPVGQAGGAGVTSTAEFLIPYTGSTVGEVQVRGVALPAGTQWMRLVMDTNAGTGFVGNFAAIDLTREGTGPRNPVSASATSRVEAEDYDTGGEGVAYHDVDNGGQTDYRPDNVGVYEDSNASGGHYVGYCAQGEWYRYTLNVAQAGPYGLTAHVSAPAGGGHFHVEFGPAGGAATVSSPEFTVPYGAGWYNIEDVSVPAVSLPAGPVWMRVVVDDAYPCNFDFFRLTPGALLPTATGLTLSPSTVAGGGSAGGTVTLSGPAPGTMALSLSSDSPAAQVPASVLIYGGSTQGYFTVTTSPVSSDATAHITASGAGSPVTGALALSPTVSLTYLGVYSYTDDDGSPIGYGYFGLNGPAPAGGLTVTLASDCASATVPQSVQVPAGSSWGSFPVTVSAVTAPVTAHITASAGGVTKEADLPLVPFGLAWLSVYPDAVHGGDPASGYISLTGPAPAGGLTVGLTSDSTSVTVPPSVTIPEGWNGNSFTVTTSAVTVPVTAHIIATGTNGPLTAALGLTPDAAPSGLTATAYPTGPTSVVVNLNWTAAGAGGYAIERSPDASTWAQIGTSSGTSYQDATASGGTHYWYRVRASGGTAYSNTAYADTGFPWLVATDLAWTPDPVYAGDQVHFYAVIQNIGTASTQVFGWSVEFEGDAYGGYNIEANPLAPGDTILVTEQYNMWWTATPGTYHPTVVIDDSYGTLTRTLTVACRPPTGLTATTVSSSEIDLSWIGSAGANGYAVERSPDGSTGWTQIGTSTETTYPDTGLSAGSTYFYRVRATSGGAASDPSNVAGTAPIVSVLSARIVQGQVALSWSAVPGVSTYNVYRGTTAGGEAPVPYQTVVMGTGFTDAAVVTGTTYYYRIGAPGDGVTNEVAADPHLFPKPLRVNAGGDRYTDSRQNVWEADEDFLGGQAVTTPAAISGTDDPALYQNGRSGTAFTYDLPVANGAYTVSLLLADTQATAPGQNVFGVTANGSTVLTAEDAFADAGATDTAFLKNFPVRVSDGHLSLAFTALTGDASVAAIELVPIPGVGMGDNPPPDWAGDTVPTDASDGGDAGPASSEDVSLPAGVEENNPGPDMWAFNPIGPGVSFERSYRSSLAAGGYASPGLSLGWVHNYDLTVRLGDGGALVLYYPSGATETWVPASYGAFTVPPGAPYFVTGVPATGPGQWQSLTMTLRDRSQYVFTPDLGRPGGYLLTQIVNLVGHAVTLQYDGADRLTGILNDAYPAATLLQFSYSDGLLSSVQDDTGRQVSYAYTRQPEAVGQMFALTSVSSIASASDTPVSQWQYDYTTIDAIPILSSVGTPSPTGTGTSTTVSLFDTSGRVLTHRDTNGNERRYTYAGGLATIQVGHPVTVGASTNFIPDQQWIQNFTTGSRNLDTGFTDAASHSTLLTYGDPQNPYLPTAVTDRNNQTASVTYDAFGNVLSEIDARGVTVNYTYDYVAFPLGQLTKVQTSYGISLLAPTTFEYYPSGQIKTVHRPAAGTVGNSSTATVDTTYTYTALGNVATVDTINTNGTLHVVYNYTSGISGYTKTEALGEPVLVTTIGRNLRAYPPSPAYPGWDQDYIRHAYKYDSRGNRIADIQTDTGAGETGKETNFSFNGADQVVSVTYPSVSGWPYIDFGTLAPTNCVHTDLTYQYPGGPVTDEAFYDEQGHLIRHTSTTYGPEGELIAASGDTDPVTYHYDSLYRMTGLTDGNNNTTSYDFDPVGNLVAVRYPGHAGRIDDFDLLQYSYDPGGLLTKRIDGNAMETDYFYDETKTVLADVRYLDTSQQPNLHQFNVHLDYDDFGRRRAMTDRSGSKLYTYDDLDDLTSVTTNFNGGPQNQQITYEYYSNGSLSLTQTPAGHFGYYYTGIGDLGYIAPPWARLDGYDPMETWVPQGTDFPGHYIGWFLGSSMHYYFEYNGRGDIKAMTSTWAGEVAGTSAYYTPGDDNIVDATGNVLMDTRVLFQRALYNPGEVSTGWGSLSSNTSGTTYYGYNRKGELRHEHKNFPDVSLFGNSPGYRNNIFDPHGAYPYTQELYNTYDYPYDYDAAGNPTMLRRVPAYGFNADNQATNLTYDGNGSLTSRQSESLTYDPENHLIGYGGAMSATYDGDGLRTSKQGVGGTTYYLYDGDVPFVEEDAAGNVQAYSVYGPFGLETRRDFANGGGAITTYIFDRSGNLMLRPGVDCLAFDAYGKLLADIDDQTDAPETYQDPVGFAGQFGGYTDRETGLVLMGARYYDPEQGRFLTRDPIGYAGGLNLYRYADNNPVNESDPSGMDPDGHTLGDWVDNHMLGGAIDNWGNVEGEYEGGRATLADRNWAAVRGSTEVVGLATSVVGVGSGVRLIVRGAAEKALVKTVAKESDEQLQARVSGQNTALKRLWGTGGDGAITAIEKVRSAKFYHLPRGVNRQALLAYKQIIKRNVSKRLRQNLLGGKTLPYDDPGLRRNELIDLVLKKTMFR